MIMDDPDAPGGTFTHWVCWGIPPETKAIPGGAAPGVQGTGTSGRTGYRGPCPPAGPAHTYRFRLYALDAELGLEAGATREELEKAMEGHVLAIAELDGEFGR